MSTALSQAFHGQPSYGEGEYPGSGGNLNSVYAGDGYYEKGRGSRANPADEGYQWGLFPSGALPSGAEAQEFRISDSNAFNNLRGIAKTSFPFDPYPSTDSANQRAASLADNFQQSDMAGISSLLPGKYSYNSAAGTLSQSILDEFNAGTSTFNSLPNGETAYGNENQDKWRRMNNSSAAGFNQQIQEGINTSNLIDQFRASFTEPAVQDVPLMPFSKTYFNFGEGKVDYGFQEPGADKASEDIIRAFHAVLPEGQLAGTKKELMPVFSGISQSAVEQRPILQSLGKQKNTLYLGGLTELPDELRISPEEALLSGSNIPANLVQTAGELASALDMLGWNNEMNSLKSGNSYGAVMQNSKMLSNENAEKMPPQFYDYLRSNAYEPLLFADDNIYQYSSSESDILTQ